MNNSGKCWQISFAPLSGETEIFENFVTEYFEVLTNNFGEDGTDNFVGYQKDPFNEDDFRNKAKFFNISVPGFNVELLTSDNWLKDNVIKFEPFEVGKFLIYGIHEKKPPQSERIPIQIYAATAFGSEHQTTKSCLLALTDLYKKKVPHQNILDVGCGSGILSIAAAKLWQNETHVTSVDIDQEAIWVTEQNALNNQLSNYITVGLSDGYKSDLVKENAPYDIIFSNILARPLIEMAPDLSKSLKSGGSVILSGFIKEQENWVIDAHIQQGLELIKIYEQDNWRAALMEKK